MDFMLLRPPLRLGAAISCTKRTEQRPAHLSGAARALVVPCKRRRNSAILRHVEGSSPTDPRDYDVFLLSRGRRRFLMNTNI